MKINRSSKKSKKLILSFGILFLIASAVFGVYLVSQHNNEERRKQESLKSIDANKSENTKPIEGTSPSNKDTSAPSDPGGEKTIIPSEPGTSTRGTLEKPTITRATQSGSNVRISAIFNQPAYGSCVVTLSQQGQLAISKITPIIVGPSYYTCNGFLIPRTEFPTKGTWGVTVTHENNGQSVTSDTQSVVIE